MMMSSLLDFLKFSFSHLFLLFKSYTFRLDTLKFILLSYAMAPPYFSNNDLSRCLYLNLQVVEELKTLLHFTKFFLMDELKELSCSPLKQNSSFPSLLGKSPPSNLFNFVSVPPLNNSYLVEHFLKLPEPNFAFIISSPPPFLDPGCSVDLHFLD